VVVYVIDGSRDGLNIDRKVGPCPGTWPLHDIALPNFVCCIAYKRGVGGGGVHCAIVVQ